MMRLVIFAVMLWSAIALECAPADATYGAWVNESAVPGLQARVNCDPNWPNAQGQYEWTVEFRNASGTPISDNWQFELTAVGHQPNDGTLYSDGWGWQAGMQLAPGQMWGGQSEGGWAYIKASCTQQVRVWVETVPQSGATTLDAGGGAGSSTPAPTATPEPVVLPSPHPVVISTPMPIALNSSNLSRSQLADLARARAMLSTGAFVSNAMSALGTSIANAIAVNQALQEREREAERANEDFIASIQHDYADLANRYRPEIQSAIAQTIAQNPPSIEPVQRGLTDGYDGRGCRYHQAIVALEYSSISALKSRIEQEAASSEEAVEAKNIAGIWFHVAAARLMDACVTLTAFPENRFAYEIGEDELLASQLMEVADYRDEDLGVAYADQVSSLFSRLIAQGDMNDAFWQQLAAYCAGASPYGSFNNPTRFISLEPALPCVTATTRYPAHVLPQEYTQAAQAARQSPADPSPPNGASKVALFAYLPNGVRRQVAFDYESGTVTLISRPASGGDRMGAATIRFDALQADTLELYRQGRWFALRVTTSADAMAMPGTQRHVSAAAFFFESEGERTKTLSWFLAHLPSRVVVANLWTV